MAKTGSKSERKKQLLSTLVTLVVLVIVFAFVVPGLGSYEEAFNQISTMAASSVFFLSLLTVINILVYVLPYLAAVVGLKYGPAFVLRQTSFLFSNALPGGGAIAFGVQIAMLKSYKFSTAIASSAIVITSAWNFYATISLPGLAALVLLLTGQLDQETITSAVVGIVVAVLSIGSFILIFRSESLAKKLSHWLDDKLNRFLAFIKRPNRVDLEKSILEFRASSYDVTVKRWPALAASNLAQQLSQFSLLYASLVIMEPAPVSMAVTFSIFAVSRLGSFIPLTPGGIGTVDAIMVSMLISSGIDSDIALAATLIWRLTTYLPQMAVGLCTFLYWRVRHR